MSLNFMDDAVDALDTVDALDALVALDGNASEMGSPPAAIRAASDTLESFVAFDVVVAVVAAGCGCSSNTCSCDTISSLILISVWSSMVSSMYVFRIISSGMLSRMLSKMHSLIMISNSLPFFWTVRGGMPRSNKYTLVYSLRAQCTYTL